MELSILKMTTLYRMSFGKINDGISDSDEFEHVKMTQDFLFSQIPSNLFILKVGKTSQQDDCSVFQFFHSIEGLQGLLRE